MSDWNRRSWSWVGKDADGAIWVQLEYEKPFSAQSLNLLTTFQKELSPGRLMASDNGTEWREVLSYDLPRRWMSISRSFPETTEIFCQVVFGKFFVNKSCRCLAQCKGFSLQDIDQETPVCCRAKQKTILQGLNQSVACRFTVFAPGDDLGDHGIIER